MFCAQGPSVVRRNRAHRGKTEALQRTRQIRRCQQFAKHRHSRQKCSIISHVGVCPTQTTARGHTPSITTAKRLERNQNPSRIRGNIATTNTGEDHQADTGLVRQWWNAHGQPGGENLAAPSQRLKVSVPRLSVNFQSQTISAFNGNMLTGLSFGPGLCRPSRSQFLLFEPVAISSNCPEIRPSARKPNLPKRSGRRRCLKHDGGPTYFLNCVGSTFTE